MKKTRPSLFQAVVWPEILSFPEGQVESFCTDPQVASAGKALEPVNAFLHYNNNP